MEQKPDFDTIDGLADHLVNHGAQMLKEFGDILPVFHAVTAHGEHVPIGVPMAGDAQKEMVCTAIKQLFKQMQVVRYGTVFEGWAADSCASERDYRERPPSKRDDRYEVMNVTVIDRDGKSTARMYRIERGDDAKPYLGKEIYKVDGLELGGRFMELLEDE